MDKLMEPAGTWITEAPWRDRAVLLIRGTIFGGWSQAWTIADKKRLLERPEGMVIAVWSGRFHATARYLTEQDRVTVAGLL